MIALERGGGDENRSWKNQTGIFDFFAAIFVIHRVSCDDRDGGGWSVGWLADENRDQKNRTDVFNFFGRDFCNLIFLPTVWEFKILKTVWRRCNIANSRVLRLRWVNSQECWTMMQYRKLEDSVIAMGGNWFTKIAAKKSATSVWFFRLRFLSPNFLHHNNRTLEFGIVLGEGEWMTKIAPKKSKTSCR